MSTWSITGRHPNGITYTSDDGKYQIWSAKPGTGHMLRSPDDPMRFVVSHIHSDHITWGVYRTWKLAYAKTFCEQHAKGIVK